MCPKPVTTAVKLARESGEDHTPPSAPLRRRLAAQLEEAVAFGYLLLAPLLTAANLQRQHGQAQATNLPLPLLRNRIEALLE